MNWYTYKVLAESYDADRKRQAAQHRQVRLAARANRATAESTARPTGARAADRIAQGNAGAPSGRRPHAGWTSITNLVRLPWRPSVSR